MGEIPPGAARNFPIPPGAVPPGSLEEMEKDGEFSFLLQVSQIHKNQTENCSSDEKYSNFSPAARN